MSDTMRWGLIGSRGYAARACAPALREAEGAELVAVLGRDRERARALLAAEGAPGADATGAATDLDAFLATPGLEAVWVASPTYLHHDQVQAAIAAGKHVLAEKPLATTSAEAWSLVEAAERAGVTLATGYQARYVPGHRAMRDLIAGGGIGQVTAARSYYGILRDGPPPDWRQDVATAGWGILADVGTHHLDLLRMLLGEIDTITGVVVDGGGHETDTAAAVALGFASGAVGTLTATAGAAVPMTLVEVIGTEATIVARDTSPTGSGPILVHRPGAPDEALGPPRPPSSIVAQVDAVTRVARGADEPFASGADGARTIELLEALLA